jgi:hypothetical protein
MHVCVWVGGGRAKTAVEREWQEMRVGRRLVLRYVLFQ